MRHGNRAGLTVIEIVIAILILSVGGLALAGSSALMIRRLAESARGTTAAAVAARRLESSFATSCGALTGGGEDAFGVRSDWFVSGAASSIDIRQRVTYPTRRGYRSEDFLTAAPCD